MKFQILRITNPYTHQAETPNIEGLPRPGVADPFPAPPALPLHSSFLFALAFQHLQKYITTMHAVTIHVPEEIIDSIRLPEAERKERMVLELAVGLYANRLLPLGKSAKLAGVNRYAFIESLIKRGISQSYDLEELEYDLPA